MYPETIKHSDYSHETTNPDKSMLTVVMKIIQIFTLVTTLIILLYGVSLYILKLHNTWFGNVVNISNMTYGIYSGILLVIVILLSFSFEIPIVKIGIINATTLLMSTIQIITCIGSYVMNECKFIASTQQHATLSYSNFVIIGIGITFYLFHVFSIYVDFFIKYKISTRDNYNMDYSMVSNYDFITSDDLGTYVNKTDDKSINSNIKNKKDETKIKITQHVPKINVDSAEGIQFKKNNGKKKDYKNFNSGPSRLLFTLFGI